MNEYGLVISEAGYDADTCAPENTIFDTRFDTPKALVSDSIVTVGRVTIIFATTPGVGTTRLFTVKHNFGYTPLYFSYMDRKNSSTPAMGYTVGHYYVGISGVSWLGQIICRANETELWYEFLHLSGSPDINMIGKTFTFNYYLFCNDSK